MERKTFTGYLQKADDDRGIVDHIFAVFGNVDGGLDRIIPGSFRKTLAERRDDILVLDQHNNHTIFAALGVPLEIREVGKKELPVEVKQRQPDATGGVFASTQFLMDTAEGRGAYIRLRDKAVKRWSFGYDALDVGYSNESINGKKVRIRELKELRLYEYSPVLFAMNEATATIGAKSNDYGVVPIADPKLLISSNDTYHSYQFSGLDDFAPDSFVRSSEGYKGKIYFVVRAVSKSDGQLKTVAHCYPIPYWQEPESALHAKNIDDASAGKFFPAPETKAVTPYQDYPLADRDREWNSSEAEARVREWAGGEDDLDWSKYGKAHLWHDGDNAENLTAYKLGYVDIIDGEPYAIPRAIFTIANPARGIDAADGPTDSEKERLRNHVARYYAKMREEFEDDDIVPPWEKSQEPGTEEKAEYVFDTTMFKDGEPLILPPYTPGGDNTELLEELLNIVKPKAEPEAQESKMMDYHTLGNTLTGNLHYAFNCLVDKWLILGYMDQEDHAALRSALDDAIKLFTSRVPDELAELEIMGPLYPDSMGYYANEPEMDQKAREAITAITTGLIEVKAGRVLSANNAEKIQRALATLTEVLMSAGLIEENAMDEEDEEDDKQGPQPAPYLLKEIEVEQEELGLIRLQ